MLDTVDLLLDEIGRGDSFDTIAERCAREQKEDVLQIEALGREAAKPYALIYILQKGLAHGTPLMASMEGGAPALFDANGPSITDEGIGENDNVGGAVAH